MLREDGMVMDDGTTSRISENHFHMTTTTAQAANVLTNLEYYLQVVWPELDVNVLSTTEPVSYTHLTLPTILLV